MRTQGKSSIPLRGTSGRTRHTKIETPPSADTDRCLEHLRAALSHDIVLRDGNIPQLPRSWDNNITDLVSGIPLKLPPIWEVNHEINLIDPKKHIHYRLPKCPEQSTKNSLRELRDTPLHSGGYLQWHTKQCQCFAYQRKMVNYILFSIYENRTTTWSRM